MCEHTSKGLTDAQLALDHLTKALDEDKNTSGGIFVNDECTIDVVFSDETYEKALWNIPQNSYDRWCLLQKYASLLPYSGG